MRRLGAVWVAVALAVTLAAPARAETGAGAVTGAWDHAANVKDAATRLVKLHKREGSTGVLKFLDACYRTHTLGSSFSQGLEACMAQDYMHSQVLAQIYSKLPEADRKKLGAPSAEAIAAGMGRRFVAAFAQYKVPVKEAEAFRRLVDQHGFPVFVRGVLPQVAPADAGQQKAN